MSSWIGGDITYWNALRNGLVCHSSEFLKIVISGCLTFHIFQYIVIQQLKCEYCSDLFICRRIIPHLNELDIFRSSIRATTDTDRKVMNTIGMNYYHQFSTCHETGML